MVFVCLKSTFSLVKTHSFSSFCCKKSTFSWVSVGLNPVSVKCGGLAGRVQVRTAGRKIDAVFISARGESEALAEAEMVQTAKTWWIWAISPTKKGTSPATLGVSLNRNEDLSKINFDIYRLSSKNRDGKVIGVEQQWWVISCGKYLGLSSKQNHLWWVL